jgi:hypothetical protein
MHAVLTILKQGQYLGLNELKEVRRASKHLAHDYCGITRVKLPLDDDSECSWHRRFHAKIARANARWTLVPVVSSYRTVTFLTDKFQRYLPRLQRLASYVWPDCADEHAMALVCLHFASVLVHKSASVQSIYMNEALMLCTHARALLGADRTLINDIVDAVACASCTEDSEDADIENMREAFQSALAHMNGLLPDMPANILATGIDFSCLTRGHDTERHSVTVAVTIVDMLLEGAPHVDRIELSSTLEKEPMVWDAMSARCTPGRVKHLALQMHPKPSGPTPFTQAIETISFPKIDEFVLDSMKPFTGLRVCTAASVMRCGLFQSVELACVHMLERLELTGSIKSPRDLRRSFQWFPNAKKLVFEHVELADAAELAALKEEVAGRIMEIKNVTYVGKSKKSK